ncbi:TPA: signal recognition particle-docking protein FtsY [Proteus mirabilis]|uniref:signal recognition particle-docking protein FtsY n=1 Tax=Proteus mirabilis TaxID=584 RepID=UPI00053833D8|nr:signal recognition particle-docking protein FtsY [Proteus mirabilis]AUU14954.1 signal recognition particle-docking protein FtsY [Proteus mirabilis]EKU7867006.1 signal recognition particle-docking protein FtsY [Proteus mirabilis]EKU7878179.1 signal recognition particle-docking protein FtsY [Proteus mirabilis]ELA7785510.1 signal recognition particle-docking protein FtsY [Proteus mirabilis]MBG2895528.1 signal recognition particle-docking protein FtsY [Proteus mirabilis]
MAKEKKGFFSWLGFGRNKEENTAQEKEQQRLEAERAEQARLAEEEAQRQAQLEAEQARQEAQRVEAEKLAAERAEQARLAEEEAQRQAQLKAEQARQEAQRAEAERLAAERTEQARLAEEEAQRQAQLEAEQARQEAQRAEAERLAAERAEQARLAEEEAQRQAQQEAEQARQEAQRAEAERLAAERAEQARLAEEEAQRQAQLEAEQARQEAQRAEAQRLAAERAEQTRLAEEEAQRQAQLEAEQARQEAQRAEAERLAAERAEQTRLAEEEAQRQAQLEAEQARQEAEEKARIAQAQAEAEDIVALREEVLVDKPVEQERPKKEGFFSRLKKGLLKTRQNLGSGFMGLFRGKKIDDELFEELEEQLLIADVGMDTTSKIINSLTQHASRKDLKDAESLYGKLREEMGDILNKVDKPLNIEGKKPFVILMVGVNGVGKTTTIGKLARQYQAEGKSVMLAAGDTFRAAAVEQLQVWGERNHIPVIAQHTGADPASVIFDAIQSAQAKGVDVLIADTAGRLQNKSHLMEELKKIVRVMKKLDEEAPHEVMLTLDASTGQNAVSQAKLFNETVGLTGLTLTKLDGTAKGGVIFSIADQFGIPIRYIGVGEGIEDLRPFKADDFIEALFAREE